MFGAYCSEVGVCCSSFAVLLFAVRWVACCVLFVVRCSVLLGWCEFSCLGFLCVWVV